MSPQWILIVICYFFCSSHNHSIVGEYGSACSMYELDSSITRKYGFLSSFVPLSFQRVLLSSFSEPAHARLMFRTIVLPQDAIIAVFLLECSMHTSSILGLPSVMHSQNPLDPDVSCMWIAFVHFHARSTARLIYFENASLMLYHFPSSFVSPSTSSGARRIHSEKACVAPYPT
jgi:hypothetical protein